MARPMLKARTAPLLLALMLAGCATEMPPRIAAPPPPLPVVALPPPTMTLDWRDLPLSPGSWRYAKEPEGFSAAQYGIAGQPASFVLRCDRNRHQLSLVRGGVGPGPDAVTIKTSTSQRTMPTNRGVATLAAADRFLDEMAFSRGRFTVAAAGTTTLVMPAWAEPARVIEDCRGQSTGAGQGGGF